MSEEGIRLQLKGKTFKFELLQIVGSVIEAAAKTLVAVKTGGAWLAISPNLITGFFGALKGIKRTESLELRAWLLVSGGLLYAIEKTISDTKLTKEPSAVDLKELINDIGIRVETRDYFLETEFFEKPNQLLLLEDVAHEVSAWLTKFGGADKPKETKSKLDSYFTAGLHRTWTKDPELFSAIDKALNSPFASQIQLRQQLDGYLQYIEEQFTELKLIGQVDDSPDAVTLAQVFVPLRAYCDLQQNTAKQSSPAIESLSGPGQNIKVVRHVFYLFSALEKWLATRDKRDVIRIISGGPGIGKSSSMRAFAAKIARSRAAYPLLIPLQKLEKPDQPLRDRIKEFLINNRSIPLKKSPLELEEAPVYSKPILLIFDGLDELVRPGKDAEEVARDFMSDLRQLLEQENGQSPSQPPRVLAVVTGRVASAGSASRALKFRGEQVISLLRFAEDPHSHYRQTEYHDPQKLLSHDQRVSWWSLWREANKKGVPENIPQILLDDDLFEVTVEPLLLYFVAFIRPWETRQSVDRNAIYHRLLVEFYNRELAKGILNFAAEFPDFARYEVVLQAMALASWYDGSTRTGTIDVVFRIAERL